MSGESGEKKDEGVGVDACLLSALERVGVGLVAGFLGSMTVRRRWPIVLGLGFAVGQGIGDCREDLCGEQCQADRETRRKSGQKEQDQNEQNEKKEEEKIEEKPTEIIVRSGKEKSQGERGKTDQGEKEETRKIEPPDTRDQIPTLIEEGNTGK